MSLTSSTVIIWTSTHQTFECRNFKPNCSNHEMIERNYDVRCFFGIWFRYLKKSVYGPSVVSCSGGWSRIFAREGGFSKKYIVIFVDTLFFRSWLNWFFELSQSTEKSLFWPNFLHCRRNFEKKNRQKRRLNRPKKTFWKTMFFRRALPSQS